MNLKLLAKRLTTALLLLAMPFIVSAQQKTVNGKITSDKDGSPISGATVLAKGSKKGTQTAADGSFVLEVPAATTKLVISSVGFGTQELTIGADNTANLVLNANNEGLTEIVVVGYGTARKKDLTGSVAVVTAKNFNQGALASPDQLIQGKVAGLQVLSNSGQPGAATTVRIRGNASVRQGAGQPLYVVDGIPLDGRNARPQLSAVGLGSTPDVDPLLFINANDISNVQVLKDASASAIFGSRGANGVILIETKKGNGAPKVDFLYQIGSSKVSKKYNVLDAAGYKSALSQYGIVSGDQGSAVDAQSEIFRKGLSQNVNVAVSGSTDKSNYRISLGYFGQEGVVKSSDLKKYMLNFQGSSKVIGNKVNLDYGVRVGQVNEKIAPVSENAGFEGSLIGNALQWNPTRAFRKPNGEFDQPAGALNPLALLEAYNDRSNLLNASIFFSPTIKITKDLEFKVSSSISTQTGKRNAFMKDFLNQTDIVGKGWAFSADNTLSTSLINTVLNYKKSLGSNIKIDALVGYEYFKSDRKGSSAFGKDFKDIPVNYTNILQYASQSSLAIGSFVDPSWELQSYFGRAALNFKDRYLVTATLRADGSSKFGKDNKYGYFPSFAIGWNVSNESFMKDISAVNNLKIRLGYGVTGSQEFPSGAAQDQYTFSQQSFALNNVANPKLKWEKEKQLNIGMDFSLFKNINVNVDYFKKDRTDILFNTQVTLPGPATKYWVNVPCNIINTGIEVNLNADIVSRKDLTWNLAVNATFMKNKLTNYKFGKVLTGVISGQGLSGVSVQELVNDQPLNAFYTKQFEGFDGSGGSKFPNGLTKTYAGNPNPNTLLGIRSELNYKKISLVLNGYGIFGQKVYNNTANATVGLGNLGKGNVDVRFIGTGEAVANTPSASTRYIEDGSFFRLSNASLSYNIGNIGNTLKNVNVFLTGTNLFVITKFTGFDPEVNTNKQIDGVSSFGIEYTPYPAAKTFLAGFRVSF
jgi:TonB-dependent starch-binding outer membrane protein SusC